MPGGEVLAMPVWNGSPNGLAAVADIAADAARLRARSAARRSSERGLADVIIGRLSDGGDSQDTDALLAAAGLRPEYLAVAFRAHRRPDARLRGGGEDRAWLGFDRDLAEELLAGYAGESEAATAAPTPPESPVPPESPAVAVAVAGDEVLAVLSGTNPERLAGWLRDASPVLQSAGVALSAGIAGPAADASALAGAVREAAAARRVAAARGAGSPGSPGDPGGPGGPGASGGDGVRVATSAQVDSHELLLASVPAPVLRSFRERLLGPLAEYDARHNAELLPTLKSFLACDGSWSACATRMYVHVNTVRYRISRIEALTGRDLSALADRVDFFLALRGA